MHKYVILSFKMYGLKYMLQYKIYVMIQNAGKIICANVSNNYSMCYCILYHHSSKAVLLCWQACLYSEYGEAETCTSTCRRFTAIIV